MKSMYGGLRSGGICFVEVSRALCPGTSSLVRRRSLDSAPGAIQPTRQLLTGREPSARPAPEFAGTRKTSPNWNRFDREMLKNKKSLVGPMWWKTHRKKPAPGWRMPRARTKRRSRPCAPSLKKRNPPATNLRTFRRGRCWPIFLLEAKHPDQALAEYETDLKFNPNRFNGLYGAASAAEKAGKNRKGRPSLLHNW